MIAGMTIRPATRRGAPPSGSLSAADLRTRILEVSADLVAREGLAALSMREVARRAGVTHQAPYHHFADRESILAELVQRGFDELARRLDRAICRALPRGAHAVLADTGMAYVAFALENEGLFRTMFRPEIVDHSRFADAQAAGDRAYAQLERMVAAVHGRCTPELATMHWAQVHGLAGLLLDGGLSHKLGGPRAQRAHARAALDAHAALCLGEGPVARGAA
jgi:AcrR family transcriptional regulator